MKLILLCTISFLVVSCGGKNSSGKPVTHVQEESGLLQVESSLREEFYDQGKEILRIYQYNIKRVLGDKVFIRMNRELRKSNIVFSNEILRNSDNRPTRSYRTVEGITVLYIGNNHSDLNWSNYLYRRDIELHRMIMHELIEMAGVADQNLQYTIRIIGR